jgi:hypothetical protein
MMQSLMRFFGYRAEAQKQTSFGRCELSALRQLVVQTLHDCSNESSERVVQRVRIAKSSQELWVLRSDLYQCIAQAHSQTEAVERINSLIDAFEGWIPSAQLKFI